MVVKVSILNWLIQMSNLYGVSGEALWRVWKRDYVQNFLHACSHSLIPSLPFSGTQICIHMGRAWYLLACEHDVIKIGPEFLEQKTFCVLFNQLCIQRSVCMIFDSR